MRTFDPALLWPDAPPATRVSTELLEQRPRQRRLRPDSPVTSAPRGGGILLGIPQTWLALAYERELQKAGFEVVVAHEVGDALALRHRLRPAVEVLDGALFHLVPHSDVLDVDGLLTYALVDPPAAPIVLVSRRPLGRFQQQRLRGRVREVLPQGASTRELIVAVSSAMVGQIPRDDLLLVGVERDRARPRYLLENQRLRREVADLRAQLEDLGQRQRENADKMRLEVSREIAEGLEADLEAPLFALAAGLEALRLQSTQWDRDGEGVLERVLAMLQGATRRLEGIRGQLEDLQVSRLHHVAGGRPREARVSVLGRGARDTRGGAA